MMKGQSIDQAYGATMAMRKSVQAHQMLRDNPGMWFPHEALEPRDYELITAESVPFVDYEKGSYLRKMYHMQKGKGFEVTDWTVEGDEKCKKMVGSAGGKLCGFNFPSSDPVHWASVTVNVNIKGTPASGFDWGFLSTRPSNIRIAKGPLQTCSLHPWDAMILQDCTTNTDTLNRMHHIASRRWDILVMKMCEDYDYPWVVVAVKDAGPFVPDSSGCGCQDEAECGCILPK